jgi:glycosyltransferase involved in cell wall biosynthesis
VTDGPRVLMVTGDFPPAITGVGDYTHHLVQALTELGAAVQVFTGVPRESGAASAGDWGIGVIRRVLRAADRLGTRPIVHVQYPGLAYGRNPAINLLPGLVKLLQPRAGVVVTMHEYRTMRRRWRLRVVPMLLAADAIILPDEVDRRPIARWARRARGRISVVPIGSNVLPMPMSGADRTAWRAELGLPGADPIVAFFGGVYEHKGVLELVAAVQGLRRRGLPARLLIIGAPFSDPRFKTRVERLLSPDAGTPWARWLADAPPDVVSRSLMAADIAALPFRSGAMPNRGSLLTVLAHAVPAVTTRTAATPASFGPATGMALVPPGDAAALEAKLEELLRDASAREALREAGARYARTFSWEAIGRRTLEVYRTLGGNEPTESQPEPARPDAALR